MTGYIMDVKNVTVSFDGFKVLNDLNFSINHGELRFLIGPNGAGKSTLLDIMTGKTRPDKGKVTFDDRLNVARVTEHQLVREGIGRKFQTPTVFGSLSVYDNLEAAIGFKTSVYRLGTSLSPEQRDHIDETLEIINLKDRSDVLAGTLSHGQKQWLEIGMLLVQEPKLVLLDEPVAGMTRRERDHTGELLHRIMPGRSILVVEHDMVFVRQFASCVTVLHMGQVLCEGPVEQVQNDPQVIEVYIGRSKAQSRLATQEQIPMLSVNGLQVFYGQSLILNDVSIEVASGEVVCLMGRNGVGKTTLIKSIMGLLKVKQGKIVYDGKDITNVQAHKRAISGIGYVPQGRGIFPYLTVYENLLMGLEALDGKQRRHSQPAIDEVYTIFPVLKQMGEPCRRDVERRTAAAVGDWARAGARPSAFAARRADRRHSTEYRRRYRERDPLSART